MVSTPSDAEQGDCRCAVNSRAGLNREVVYEGKVVKVVLAEQAAKQAERRGPGLNVVDTRT